MTRPASDATGPIIHTYSSLWFETFLFGIPDAQTGRELDFLGRQIPADRFRTVLDVCCGAGRHAHGLTRRGRTVLGIDRSRRALERAVRQGEGDTSASTFDAGPPFFAQADMRALPVAGPFDAAIVMWQSWGYFDAVTNLRILRDLHGVLRWGGRLILDIYDRRFFETRQGERLTVRDGREITDVKRLDGDRLFTELRYSGSHVVDRVDWQVFTPDSMAAFASNAGFATVLQCADFDETRAPDESLPRMQVVLEARTPETSDERHRS
jgi:SAM-dependent methyltransferase